MAKTSCIPDPVNETIVVIKQWQLEFCDGDHCAASLLSLLIHWHDWKLQNRQVATYKNYVAGLHGDAPTDDETLWQFHTADQLSDELLGLYARDRIRKARAMLVEKGVVEEGRNPNPRYSFDNAIHFLLHPEVCIEWIANRKNAERYAKNRKRSAINQRPVAEKRRTIPPLPSTASLTASEFGSAEPVLLAEKAQTPKADPKPNGPKLDGIFDAFTERGMTKPGLPPGHGTAAQGLLKAGFTPEEIAECWADIDWGRYGGRWEQTHLHFKGIGEFIVPWKAWVAKGRPSTANQPTEKKYQSHDEMIKEDYFATAPLDSFEGHRFAEDRLKDPDAHPNWKPRARTPGERYKDYRGVTHGGTEW